MALTTPFAFNTGSTISGTEQVGNIAIGITEQDYSSNIGEVKWWMGPDENVGFIIVHEVVPPTQPTPVGVNAGVGFWRSKLLTNQSFLDLCNVIPPRQGMAPFTNPITAKLWLNQNGYYTNWGQNNLGGYPYTLVQLPYLRPSSGKTIFLEQDTSGPTIGTTNPNDISDSGIFWDWFDADGIDRKSYYEQLTTIGNFHISVEQFGVTAIYSGYQTSVRVSQDIHADIEYSPLVVSGSPYFAPLWILIQSADTNFVSGQTVYINFSAVT